MLKRRSKKDGEKIEIYNVNNDDNDISINLCVYIHVYMQLERG